MPCSLCENNAVAWVSQEVPGDGSVVAIPVCMRELMGWAARPENAAVADLPAFWNRSDGERREVPAVTLRTPREQILAEISGSKKH